MANLLGQNIGTNYKGILNLGSTINTPVSGTLQAITDGDGLASALNVSTTSVAVSGTLAVTGNAAFDTNVLFVDAASNEVGIGTATPAAKLDVVGASNTEFGALRLFNSKVEASLQASVSILMQNANTVGNFPSVKLIGRESTADSNLGEFVVQASNDNSANLVEIFRTAPAGAGGAPFLRMASGTGGIQFNGDTAAANALDDYEEGTWTPTITASGSNPTVTYAAGNTGGIYTKVGNLVTCSFETRWTALSGGSGNVSISGLPFTRRNTNTPDGERCLISSRLNTILGLHIVGTVSSNLTIIELEVETSVTANTALTVADLATTGTAFLRGTVTYFV